MWQIVNTYMYPDRFMYSWRSIRSLPQFLGLMRQHSHKNSTSFWSWCWKNYITSSTSPLSLPFNTCHVLCKKTERIPLNCIRSWFVRLEEQKCVADLAYRFRVNGCVDGELANNKTPLVVDDKTRFHGYHQAQCSCLPCQRGRTQVAFCSELFTPNFPNT